ncbi:hypothetical protein L0Y65_04590 [Candidatus Micrarchaeota archaeon]|nr:hypothetical protein [Candidatus Micrarchaeota archaeon]
MRRYKDNISAFEALPIILLIMIAAFIPVLLVLGPGAIDYLRSLNASIPSGLSGLLNFQNLTPPHPAENQTPAQAMPPEAQLYYSLKNLSCRTLSGDFLIEAEDVSAGSMEGLSGTEETAAGMFLGEYSHNQTTRTYVRGDWMKKVLVTSAGSHTTIWKEGRIYQCNPDCTMRLLGDEGWQAYLDGLARMRSSCAHFGRTELPASVNMSRLLRFERAGRTEMNGFRCERFLISGNQAYAQSLLNSSILLDSDQRALLWSLSHLAQPIEECLDDGTGVLVYRNLTLDLTKSYRFDYAPGGYMHVNQRTDITYYSDSVPESFLALPK